MADHEDYLPGEAPMPHHDSHESLGSDEINVAGLHGQLADNQPCIAHDLGGAKHIADSLADLNTKVSDATLEDVTVLETTMDTKVATHAALPTVHQDAPALIAIHAADASAHHAKYTDAEARAAINNIFGSDGKADVDIDLDTHKLINVVDPAAAQDADTKAARDAAILTHKGDASAHHAKYTDAEARVVHNPLSLPPPVFVSWHEGQDWVVSEHTLKNRVVLTAQYFLAPVIFPNGVTVTKLTLYGYRDDAAAAMLIGLRRVHRLGGSNIMASITADWTTGWSSKYDDTISLATINNNTHAYTLTLSLDPNDSIDDVRFSGAKIEFTG